MRWKQSTILFTAAAVLTLCACSSSPQAKEAKYLEKGKKAYQEKNYAVAIIQFKNAAEAQPRDAEPYYQLGLAYLAATD
jgi:Flp pilus assembly protein TadD